MSIHFFYCVFFAFCTQIALGKTPFETNAFPDHHVVVSHEDPNGILQLYRKSCDGIHSEQLTRSRLGCRMPACAPNGERLAFAEQTDHGIALCISDLDGKNPITLVQQGVNLLPCWAPDSIHLIWMKVVSNTEKDPARNSQLHIINTENGQSRRLFTDPEQLKYSNAMPSVSPDGSLIAFVSNRRGMMRIWVSELNGSNAKLISKPDSPHHDIIDAPFEQKVPVWSPDGNWIAHWEGVEMTHMSPYTGISNPERDQRIASTFHVWSVDKNGENRKKIGKGDDPTWSPAGLLTRAFPDPRYNGPSVVLETKEGPLRLPIIPPGKNWGRFTWIPK